jgi:2-aminoadipate transaminase
MRLSYCFPPPERIREGVRRLATVIEEELDLLATFGPGSGGGFEAGPGGQAHPADAPPTDLA